MIALCLVLVCLQTDSWAQIWTELETLRGGKLSASEASALRGHLREALGSGAEGPRADLLVAALEAFAGRDATSAARRMAALEPCPYTLREKWVLADLMPAGPERARLVRAALETPIPLTDWQALLAWNTALDEVRALRLEETALPIQLALHERYQASWSATDVALTYTALGQQEAAFEVLEQALERERSIGGNPTGLLETRGMHALGFGDEAAARDYLGLALAGGSNDAALLLSRLDLLAGRTESARRGFQALIRGRAPLDRAWRGWGTALLPPAFAEQAKLNRLPPPE